MELGGSPVTCDAAAAAAVQPCVQLTAALAAVWVRAAGGGGGLIRLGTGGGDPAWGFGVGGVRTNRAALTALDLLTRPRGPRGGRVHVLSRDPRLWAGPTGALTRSVAFKLSWEMEAVNHLTDTEEDRNIWIPGVFEPPSGIQEKILE